MTDVIRRDECPTCGGACLTGLPGTGEPALFCPHHPSGVPVQRTYMVVDDIADRVIDAMAEADGEVSYTIEGRIRAAIAAVTEEAA